MRGVLSTVLSDARRHQSSLATRGQMLTNDVTDGHQSALISIRDAPEMAFDAGLRWHRPKEWTKAINQFAILFGDRFVLPGNGQGDP